MLIFFFCKQKTAYEMRISDWSSDVCSSDLNAEIRKRLVHMLAVALDLRIDLGKVTDLAWRRETLLEILIRVFCDKLTAALRKGMPRRYVGHDDDLDRKSVV